MRTPVAVVVGFVVVLGAGSCGGDGGGATAESPEAWADALCERGVDFAGEMEGIAGNLAVLGETFESESPAPDEVASALGELGDAFGEIQGAFEAFADSVREVGPPPVEDGEAFFEELTTGLDEGVETLSEFTDLFAQLDEDMSLAELGGFVQEMEALGDPEEALGNPFETLQADPPPELEGLFDEREACQRAEERFDEIGTRFDEL